jgi:hypothetical protein
MFEVVGVDLPFRVSLPSYAGVMDVFRFRRSKLGGDV